MDWGGASPSKAPGTVVVTPSRVNTQAKDWRSPWLPNIYGIFSSHTSKVNTDEQNKNEYYSVDHSDKKFDTNKVIDNKYDNIRMEGENVEMLAKAENVKKRLMILNKIL